MSGGVLHMFILWRIVRRCSPHVYIMTHCPEVFSTCLYYDALSGGVLHRTLVNKSCSTNVIVRSSWLSRNPWPLQLVPVTRIVKTKLAADRASAMKKGRSSGTRGPDVSIIKTGGRFTNTAVPRINGDNCWQQHVQIFQAIVKSNGWTACRIIIIHQGGWRCSRGGLRVRLAELEWILPRLLLAVRGFEDMGKYARNWMVRDSSSQPNGVVGCDDISTVSLRPKFICVWNLTPPCLIWSKLPN